VDDYLIRFGLRWLLRSLGILVPITLFVLAKWYPDTLTEMITWLGERRTERLRRRIENRFGTS
jgi:hypothetical protein